MRTLLAFFLLASFSQAQEKKDAKLTPIEPAKLTRTEAIDYTKDVLPIFTAKCTVCHSGSEQKGKFDMGTFAAIMKGGRRGVAIIAGKPMDSLLYTYSSHNKAPVMPPKTEENPLTPNEVAILKLWIEQGAKGPSSPEVKARAKVVLSLPPAIVKPVRAVAISPEKADKAIVAASRGNQIHLFNAKGEFQKTLVDPTLKTADGKEAKAAHISLVESLTFSPDGKTLVSGSFQEITFWDIEKAEVKSRIPGFVDRVVALAFSGDGKLLATGGGAPTEEGEIKVLDIRDQERPQRHGVRRRVQPG
jgi:WD40 repeat protein